MRREILGDLGADVIKIEKADGDDARKWAPPYWGDMSSTFQSLNRNKRSAIVNLRGHQRARSPAQADHRAGRCRHPESAAWIGGRVRSRCRHAPRASSPTHLLHHRRVRREGPVERSAGLRSADAGLCRHDERDRRARPAAGPGGNLDHRHGRRNVVGDRRRLRRCFSERRGGGRRPSTPRCTKRRLAWMCYHAANFQASGELPTRQGSGAAMIVPYRGYAHQEWLHRHRRRQ